MITFHSKGDFSKTSKFLKRNIRMDYNGVLDRYGKMGVDALASVTPADSGATAASWDYRIVRAGDSVSIEFINTYQPNGFPVAIMLRFGHGTGTGGYVQGRDYISPVIQPIFDKMADDVWKEVTK